MGSPPFSFAPRRSTSQTKVVDFAPVLGVTLFTQQPTADRSVSITPGRRVVSLVHNIFTTIELECGPFDRATEPAFFRQLWNWSSHALAGGLFSFAFDYTKQGLTTTAAETDHDDETIQVVDSDDCEGGDPVVFVDVYEPTIYAFGTIESVPDSTHVVLEAEIGSVFLTGSVMRHAEYYPTCFLQEVKQPLTEQKASEGPGWVFKGTFETVNS